MSLMRWQPLQEITSLREAMNHLFDDTFFAPLSPLSTSQTVPLDILDQEHALVVQAAIPGFEPEQIDISVQNDVLTIRGEVESQNGHDHEGSYHLREFSRRSFQRVVRLPVPVRADEAEAEYRNGMLSLTLPKAEGAVPRRIEVRQS